MSSKYIQAQTFRIYGSGNAIGDTTLTLTSLKQIDGTTNITMTDFGTKGFMTLEPGNSSQEEQISFTGVTQNAGGTATLTGVKTVGFVSPYTETSGLAKAHPGGASAVISNTAGFYGRIATKDNDETITGTWDFTASPTAPEPTTDSQVATKKYVSDTVTGAVGTATEATYGTTKLSVAPATPGVPISVGDNDTRVPSQGENDALAGTSGTPSSTNKYVTNDDTSATSAASKVVRADGSGKIDVGFMPSSLFKFGGTGADGALTLTTGTTNIDLGGVTVFTKNYTSISITGDAKITFTNPHANGTIVIFKSQGDVTITSSTVPAIDLRGIGAAANTVGIGTANSTNYVPQLTWWSGNTPYEYSGAIPGLYQAAYISRFMNLFAGGGGGGGTAGNGGTGGAGGRGGGGLYIECGGALNISSTINASGSNGTAGSGGNSPNQFYKGGYGGGSNETSTTAQGPAFGTYGAAGGGGGGGGCIVILYNTLTSNTGTYTLTGGTGGRNWNNDVGSEAGTGGAGLSIVAQNTYFV